MIIFDLVIDLFLSFYTSLGFGTKEYKINTILEKLGQEYPKIFQFYQQNQKTFETDDNLVDLVLNLDLKNDVNKKQFVFLVQKRFRIDTL
jgi:hypothetical protein